MKSLSFIALVILVLASCNNQNTEEAATTPEAVVAAFKAKFPNVTDASWEAEEEEWEAAFEQEGKKYEALFSASGEWMETETAADSADIPLAVRDTLASQFADYAVEEAEIVETPNGTVYEFALEKETNGEEVEIEVTIDATGKVLEQEEDEGEEEDDEN